MQTSSWEIIPGDCIESMRLYLDDASVNMCVTSPPYFGLRDYGHAGQIGLEPTPDSYVMKMVEVFREVRRVLRDDGTLWLNLGDSYANHGVSDPSSVGGFTGERVRAGKKGTMDSRPRKIPDGLKQKDLLGIPWRVAFALQAPDYLGRIRRESDRAWLAALIDGEGCITILETASASGSDSYPPILQVRMCDIECIEYAAKITGLGNASPRQEPPSQEGQRGSYQWRLNGDNAADTIAEIYPHLLIKRKQAIVAWNHQSVRGSYQTKRGVKIPADALAKQQACREMVQRLNRRDPVDIPSWMIEPPRPVGPGWYLRSDVIWSKPNPMPESVTDRPTKAHEYLFLLSKSAKYYYDGEAIKEPAVGGTPGNTKPTKGGRAFVDGDAKHRTAANLHNIGARETRNRRSVWTVTTKPFKGAHFATFPPDLIEPCVLAGCPEGGTVLDPFGGAGTTALVASKLNRNSVLCEINSEYVKMAEDRLIKAGYARSD